MIHSGVDSERYTPENIPVYRDEIRKRHGLGNEPVLLLVGGDWGRKGVAEVITSLSMLDSRDAKLLVAGPGNAGAYRRMARAVGVEDRVVFVGETRDAWQYHAAADIFLLPTKYEAFGLAILEAMATGLPVLVSAVAGAAELIGDGVDGLLIMSPTDPEEIAARTDSLLDDQELRRRLGASARLTAVRYNWARVAEKTVAVYKMIIDHSDRHHDDTAAVPVA